jgi:hypothetical protein
MDRLDGIVPVEFDPSAAGRATSDDEPFASAAFGVPLATKLAHLDMSAKKQPRT